MNSNHHFHINVNDRIDISSADIDMGTIVFRIGSVTFYVPVGMAETFVNAVSDDWSATIASLTEVEA